MSNIANDMLLDLYGCAADPLRWRPLLDGLCERLQVRSAVAQIFQRDGYRMRQRWTARDSFSLANAARHDAHVNNDNNPRTDLRIVTRPPNDPILRDRDIFAADCPHLVGLKRRLSAIGLGQSIAITLPLDDDVQFSLCLHRASDDGKPLGPDEEGYLRELVPHVRQMLKLSVAREEPAVQLAAREAAIDHLHTGVILCDADRNVRWLNRMAAQIVDTSPYLGAVGGVLRCASPLDERNLRRLVAAAGQPADRPGSDRTVMSLGSGAGDAVQIATFRVPARAPAAMPCLAGPACVGLLVTDQGRPPAFSASELAGLFDLSPAEASLAAALGGGSSVSDYAEMRGISVGTARIQMKSILAKTNTHRQADLVRRICASVAAQARTVAH